jgi:metal-responsive CopG/Arc/MetJ family transcriptional regulator
VTKRTAISIPDDLFRAMERARRHAKKDRSGWIQDAVSHYLKSRSKGESIEEYFAAYRRMPEHDDPELVGLEEVALSDLADEDWAAEWMSWEATHGKSHRAR